MFTHHEKKENIIEQILEVNNVGKENKSPAEDKKNRQERGVEKRNKLDEFENQKFADDIPLEDLKIEAKDEKKKVKSKDASQSERKHKSDKPKSK